MLIPPPRLQAGARRPSEWADINRRSDALSSLHVGPYVKAELAGRGTAPEKPTTLLATLRSTGRRYKLSYWW